jgi:hypothetical protein
VGAVESGATRYTRRRRGSTHRWGRPRPSAHRRSGQPTATTRKRHAVLHPPWTPSRSIATPARGDTPCLSTPRRGGKSSGVHLTSFPTRSRMSMSRKPTARKRSTLAGGWGLWPLGEPESDMLQWSSEGWVLPQVASRRPSLREVFRSVGLLRNRLPVPIEDVMAALTELGLDRSDLEGPRQCRFLSTQRNLPHLRE